tara:strand:+ start:658 stop:1062 length:405 start_codon:yes stop_codon:yes gene_type:complete
MQKKTILVATFIKLEHLDDFLGKLKDKLGINEKSVFIFETENNDLVLTYRIFLSMGEKIDLRKEFNKTIQIHKKGNTFFTINSLNKLIERDFNLTSGNVDYSNYEVEWEKYENTIITLRNNNLEILPIKKKIIE